MQESSGEGPARRNVPTRRPLRRRVLRWGLRAGVAGVVLGVCGVGLLSCVTRPPALNSIDGIQRLDTLEGGGAWAGLGGDATISWDEHLIPSIEASSEMDAAYAMGVVHAHLRLAQMELIRRVSQGRLAEMGGPLAVQIDAAIRAIDLDRAVEEMEAGLPPETAAWIGSYCDGINAYRERVFVAGGIARPSDARTLGISYDEPWTTRDVLTLGRLVSVDVNWGRWLSLAGNRDQRGFEDFRDRLWAFGDAGRPSFGAGTAQELRVLTDISRSGSNAMVVSGARSASGGALVASDPHLGLPQPNIWCVVGYRTPSHAAVGLTIPGLPFVLVGRNEQIAWTGTNMQSSSTVLYRLPEGWAQTGERTERIAVRWWLDRTETFREHALGPVITDAGLLTRFGSGDIAMRWRGHFPSDEASAFLRAARSRDWSGYRESFGTYAPGGQNMLYGDADGNIGQVMAIEAVPAAASASRVGVVDAGDPAFAWGPGVPSTGLPASYNPEAGFLVSANNVPTLMKPALVSQGNANDRVDRMSDLLREDRAYTLDDLATIQRDTYSAASHATAQRIAELAGTLSTDGDGARVAGSIAAWDGRYDIDSAGALAYQAVLRELVELLYRERYGPGIRGTIRSGSYVHDFVREDLDADGAPDAVREALAAAGAKVESGLTWGDAHRLRLAHPIGMVPWLGRPYVFEDVAHAGSTTTIYKSAHPVTAERHRTSFGANARLLCDMGTLDDNRVVLLGGQDGWMGSDRLLDQAAVWRADGTVPLPMSPEGQAARSVRTTVLRGGASE
ncbi:MAG: penicillin acylase family protein [Phycisphaerales bacterium JB040]